MTGLVVRSIGPELEAFKQQVQQHIRERTTSLDQVKDQPIFRAYRDFFWRVGVDPTKIRPAGEALTRRILAGNDLPRINTVVDAYNMASVESSIAIAAFDLRKVNEASLFMRRARVGEAFRGIGMESQDSLSGVEIVIEDQSYPRLIAVYPYRDSDETKVEDSTSDVLFMMCGVPGIDEQSLERAMELTKDYVGRFCSGPPKLKSTGFEPSP